jgi:hypothetical protein
MDVVMPGGLEACRHYVAPRQTRWWPVFIGFFAGLWIGAVLARAMAGCDAWIIGPSAIPSVPWYRRFIRGDLGRTKHFERHAGRYVAGSRIISSAHPRCRAHPERNGSIVRASCQGCRKRCEGQGRSEFVPTDMWWTPPRRNVECLTTTFSRRQRKPSTSSWTLSRTTAAMGWKTSSSPARGAMAVQHRQAAQSGKPPLPDHQQAPGLHPPGRQRRPPEQAANQGASRR